MGVHLMGKSLYQRFTGAELKLCRRLIFDNITNPFIGTRAAAIGSLVPGAIFHSAEQLLGLQSAFDLPNGFLDLTTLLYVSISHFIITVTRLTVDF